MTVGTGDDAVKYDVQFELTVKEYITVEERDAAFAADDSGEGNLFYTQSPPSTKNHGGTDKANGGKANVVRVNRTEVTRKRNTAAHEMGHSMGLGHFKKGLMLFGRLRQADDQEITQANISWILNRAGIGNVVETEKNREAKKNPKDRQAKGVLHEEGTQPEGLDAATVENKES